MKTLTILSLSLALACSLVALNRYNRCLDHALDWGQQAFEGLEQMLKDRAPSLRTQSSLAPRLSAMRLQTNV